MAKGGKVLPTKRDALEKQLAEPDLDQAERASLEKDLKAVQTKLSAGGKAKPALHCTTSLLHCTQAALQCTPLQRLGFLAKGGAVSAKLRLWAGRAPSKDATTRAAAASKVEAGTHGNGSWSSTGVRNANAAARQERVELAKRVKKAPQILLRCGNPNCKFQFPCTDDHTHLAACVRQDDTRGQVAPNPGANGRCVECFKDSLNLAKRK
jgi:hypothetical protein